MAAPSRVLAKTKPKKWVKYYKVCNFIADLSFRNVMGDFRIKLFIKKLYVWVIVICYLKYARKVVYAPAFAAVTSNIFFFCIYSMYYVYAYLYASIVYFYIYNYI